MDDDTWEKLLRQRIAGMTVFRMIAGDEMRLIGPETPRATRILAVDAVYE